MILRYLKKIYSLKKNFLLPKKTPILICDNTASSDFINCIDLNKAYILKVSFVR